MAISWQNVFKHIQIILIHPTSEIIINIMYLSSFLVIGFILFNTNKNYNELQILDMSESYLDYNTFINIKTSSQFKSYLISLLNRLYTINPRTEQIPIFIPISPIRFITFNISNDCNNIDYTKTCTTETQKFKCVIDNLSKSFEYQCGKSYSDNKNIFQKNLNGYYSSYNLRDVNDNIDITRNTYYSTYQNKIDEMIEDKRVKAIIMQINLISPSNHYFIDVILCIEMTNYFTDVKNIFSAYVLTDSRPKTNTLLFVFIVLLCISIGFNLIKYIYEINTKCIWSVHIFLFFIVAIDVIFMVIGIIYCIEDKKLDFKVNLEKFESHLKYINIIWLLKIVFSLLVIFFPFRFLNVLSWWKGLTEPIVLTMNIIFRMFPGIIITFISFLIIVVMFLFVNYFLFNDIFEYYETMFNSFVTSFNIKILKNVYDKKKPSKIFGNLFQSKYSASMILFQALFFYFYMAIILATFVYLYKKAVISLEPKEENKHIKKLDEIEEKILIKLQENKPAEELNFNSVNKQILWLSTDKRNPLPGDMISKYNILQFKSTLEILSYLKYVFALKPEMQFRDLVYKLNIVLETNQRKYSEKGIKQFEHLAEWLTFVGSRIPIIIFGRINFERNLKMKLRHIYKLTSFINDENILEKIIKDKGAKILTISENNNFSI